jgi:hypothetical protein
LTVHKVKHHAASVENNQITSEKKRIEAKHIKTCEDLKILKQENEDLAKAKNTLSVALKSQKKVNQEQQVISTKKHPSPEELLKN